ncbi:methylmalonyl-CoA mutase family protein [Mycobacterium xenopi 3993]|nr:methylmalonyl-CoA mutase family protein [Mycobacterium xenopi 3993]
MSVDVSSEPADLAQARARWRTAVAEVLAKSTRRPADELGAEPERLLDTPTYEGFAIRALYTALDALPERPLPGEFPYVRGADAHRDVNVGWKVAEAFPGNGADDNAALLAALSDGVSALVLQVASPACHRPGSTACSPGCIWIWCR